MRVTLRLAERGLIVADPELGGTSTVYTGTPDDAYGAGLTSNVDFLLGCDLPGRTSNI